MAIRAVRTDSNNIDFINLTQVLDKSLWERYPEEESDYWNNNVIEINSNVVVIYLENEPVACGCFKEKNKQTIEIKRMYVSLTARGKGFAQKILQELELLATEQGYSYAVLETLHKQKEAISLYQKVGFTITKNYEPYIGLEKSICMKKKI